MKNIILGLFAVFFISFVSSCTDPGLIGLELQPKGEKLGIDTVFNSIASYTVAEDTLPTTGNSFSILGSYTDSIFGPTKASFYTQLRLAQPAITFNNTPVIDSAFICLVYGGGYGNVSVPHKLNVYKINTNDSMIVLKGYNSKSTFNIDPTPLVSYTFTPKLTDSVTFDGSKRTPLIKIKLDNQTLLPYLNASALQSNAAFTRALRGLYFRVEDQTPTGSVLYLSLLAIDSKVKVYYHDGQDAATVEFNFGGDAVRVGHFEHDYSAVKVLSPSQIDSTQGHAYSYIQALAGVKTKIHLPDIYGLRSKGNILINQATLEVVNVGRDTTYFKPPSKLFVIRQDALGNPGVILDQLEGASHYGGFYDPINRNYKFNITRHVQQLINSRSFDNTLYLTAPLAAVSANRVVIGGGNHPNPKQRMKLHIIYTKID